MRPILSYILPGILAAGCMLSGCSDDDAPARRHVVNFNNAKGETHKERNTVSVHSEPNPKEGQKHRSSNNFSTYPLVGSDGEPRYMVVSCPEGVTFELNVDKTGTDEVWNNDVYDGAILPYRGSDKFYISNPSGATSAFDVEFTAIYPVGDNIFVSSPGCNLKGQNHRTSSNFVLPASTTRYKVHCTDSKATFGIYEDISAGSDNKIAAEVSDGDYINMSVDKRNYYLTDARHADKPFQVMFEPVTVEWMTALDGNRLISDLTIPGTHDTGTYELEVINFGFSKCQNRSVEHQLDFGIRYFDLRVDGSMDIEHGGIPCNVSFDHIVRATADFLDKHPGEAVIYEITGDSFGADFDKYLEKNPDLASYFWLGNYVPKLSEVRGHIMIVRRYSYNGSQGLDFHSSGVWPDDTSKSGTNPDGVDYYIEDRFFSASSTDSHDTHVKRDVFNKAIDYKTDNPGTLCIAFTSVSASVSHTPYQFMWGGGTPGVDPKMCDVIVEKLKSLPDDANGTEGCNGVGIVVMDYYNNNAHDDYAHVVERLINTNFPKSSRPFDPDRLHSTDD